MKGGFLGRYGSACCGGAGWGEKKEENSEEAFFGKAYILRGFL